MIRIDTSIYRTSSSSWEIWG